MKDFTRDDIVLVLVMLTWSTTAVVVKLAVREIEPIAFTLVRSGIQMFVLLGVFLATERNWHVRRADLSRLLLIGLCGFCFNQLALVTGIQLGSASNAAILSASSPIFGLLFVILFEREHVGGQRWLGVAAAVLGVSVVIASGHGEVRFGLESLAGDLLVIAASGLFALYSVLVKPISKVYSPLQITTCGALIGMGAMVPLGGGHVLAQPWDAVSLQGWAAVLYGGSLVAITGIVWSRMISRVGATRSLVYLYLQPLFGVLLAVLILGETITPAQLIGAAVVLLGVNLARRG